MKQFLFFVLILFTIDAKENEESKDSRSKYYKQDERYCDISNHDSGTKNKPGCNGVSISLFVC